jgi:glycopeptide antibiotics resistance protein
MQRRSFTQISFLIVLLSIVTILVEFTSYYFFASAYPVLGISAFLSILCCHILLEQTGTYEACFIYTFLTVFISLIVTALTYFSSDQSTFIIYSNLLNGIVALNWLIPSIHCFIRYMTGYGSRIKQYSAFYRNNSIIFLLFYLAILIYGSFSKDAFPWVYRAVIWEDTANFTPFLVLSRQIEDYLYGMIPLSDIFEYVGSRILFFLPYGYYIALLTRRKSRLIKYLSFLILPLMVEVFQYFFFISRCDLDDVIYAYIGAILGSVLFYLTNAIFHGISGKEFLEREHYYGSSSLHF